MSATTEAADSLASVLRARGYIAPIVLAVSRGSVLIGAAIAKALDCSFDLWLAHDVPVPFHRERVLGGAAEGGSIVLDERERARLDSIMEREVVRREMRLLRADVIRFHGADPPPDVCDRIAILVDNAIATPWRVLAAIRDLLGRGAREVIVATPVLTASAAEILLREAGAVVCIALADRAEITAWSRELPLVTDRDIQIATAYAAFSVA